MQKLLHPGSLCGEMLSRREKEEVAGEEVNFQHQNTLPEIPITADALPGSECI